jgi:hypothetical protein
VSGIARRVRLIIRKQIEVSCFFFFFLVPLMKEIGKKKQMNFSDERETGQTIHQKKIVFFFFLTKI